MPPDPGPGTGAWTLSLQCKQCMFSFGHKTLHSGCFLPVVLLSIHSTINVLSLQGGYLAWNWPQYSVLAKTHLWGWLDQVNLSGELHLHEPGENESIGWRKYLSFKLAFSLSKACA